MRDRIERVGKRFVAEFQRDDVSGLAAELAYRFLFAIFPFGIFVAALSAFVATAIGFADPTGRIMGSLGDNLPPDIASAVRPQLEAVLGTAKPGLLTFGAVLALWSATGGTNALIKAMNRAWEVEETRSFFVKTATAIGLTILASVGIIGSFVTIVGASLLTSEVVGQLGLDKSTVDIASLLRWPLVFVLLSSAVALLYHWAPNFRAPWRACFAGGALFSVAWIIATWLFALYLANFANYANTYGALGGVIALMLWFYLSAMLLVSAAALMASALKEMQPTVVHERRIERGVAAGGVRQVRREVPDNTGRSPLNPALARQSKAAPVRRRRPPGRPAYRMSRPQDWALAGVVTAVGATLGALAAWALRTDRND